MENASRALLMAGGVLIALLIIGALLLMFNQLGTFQKTQSGNEKESQLATFNQEFTKYTDTDIKGVDIISLANKVIDFNQKDGISNSVDYDQKITLNIKLNSFTSIHGKNISNRRDCLFSNTNYAVKEKDNNSGFYKIINYYSDLEIRYGLKALALLSSNYSSIEDGSATIQDIAGKRIVDKDGIEITEENVAEYREYSEFKTSTFRKCDEVKYNNGQVVELSFEFVED